MSTQKSDADAEKSRWAALNRVRNDQKHATGKKSRIRKTPNINFHRNRKSHTTNHHPTHTPTASSRSMNTSPSSKNSNNSKNSQDTAPAITIYWEDFEELLADERAREARKLAAADLTAQQISTIKVFSFCQRAKILRRQKRYEKNLLRLATRRTQIFVSYEHKKRARQRLRDGVPAAQVQAARGHDSGRVQDGFGGQH